MQISVADPEFSEEFLIKVSRAVGKGAVFNQDSQNEFINVFIRAGNRDVARFYFTKDGEDCILEKKLVIDRSYYPFEFAIFELVKFFKRKKIKYILWN